MRAAVLTDFNTTPEVTEVDLGEVQPREVRVRTAATGICHSDRHGQTGGIPGLALPVVLGHEAAGEVIEVGSSVTSVRPGDHVVVAPAGSCGTCTWCSQGEPQHCSNLGRTRPEGQGHRLMLGSTPVTPFTGVGSFAEEMLVMESSLAVIPPTMPLDKAALLGCAVITGLGAVRHSARVQFGDTVAVIGCGGVGLSAIQGAALSGASRIVAVDRIAEKLDLARGFGATDTVLADPTAAVDPVEVVRELTGGVDHAIEVVGHATTIRQAFDMLGTRGTATVVGLGTPGQSVELPITDFLTERRIQGSRLGGTRLRVDVPLYAEMYLSGRLDLDPLQGRTIGLDDIPEALTGIDGATAARTIATF